MATPGKELINPRTGQRLRVVVTAQDSQGALVALECVSPPSEEREPEHVHPHQENIFEVHSGALRFRILGQERVIGPGERVVVPPATPHCFWVEGTEDARYRQEFRPALNIERFFDVLFQLAREGKLNQRGMPPFLMLGVFGRAFWDEVRVTRPPAWVQRITYALLAPIGRMAGYRLPAA